MWREAEQRARRRRSEERRVGLPTKCRSYPALLPASVPAASSPTRTQVLQFASSRLLQSKPLARYLACRPSSPSVKGKRHFGDAYSPSMYAVQHVHVPAPFVCTRSGIGLCKSHSTGNKAAMKARVRRMPSVDLSLEVRGPSLH